MIEGTRERKKKTDSSPEMPAAIESAEISPRETSTNATNLDRRKWFASLVPALGDGLVKLLRESNNLQRDIHESLLQKTDSLLDAAPEPDPEKKN
jgi:hypothetical protein